MVGQAWIVASEWAALRWLAREIPRGQGLRDVAAANAWSLLIVGVLGPLCASGAGWVLAVTIGATLYGAGWEQASSTVSAWILALTGWVFDSPIVRRVLPWQWVTWFLISFVLSVSVEQRVLSRRWVARGASTVHSVRTCWVMNAISYTGLGAALGLIGVRYLRQ
jgi:hypothetical protein